MAVQLRLLSPPPRWAWPSGVVCVLGGCRNGRPLPAGWWAHTHTGGFICVREPRYLPVDAIHDPLVPSRPGWVLRHEIAHVLADHHGHTEIWRSIYTLLGGGPDLRHWLEAAGSRRMSTTTWSRRPMHHRTG
jgi:hypothetical protein